MRPGSAADTRADRKNPRRARPLRAVLRVLGPVNGRGVTPRKGARRGHKHARLPRDKGERGHARKVTHVLCREGEKEVLDFARDFDLYPALLSRPTLRRLSAEGADRQMYRRVNLNAARGLAR